MIEIEQLKTQLDEVQTSMNALLARGQGRVFTFTTVNGTRACDAKCPFCVSRMTGFRPRAQLDKQRLLKAAQAAKIGDCKTWLISGKGEPTLYPEEISEYLDVLEGQFPFVEIQTNALLVGDLARFWWDDDKDRFNYTGDVIGGLPVFNKDGYTVCLQENNTLRGYRIRRHHLESWVKSGLTTVAISVVDFKSENNARIYRPNYPDLELTIKFLHYLGLSVRLCVMMQKGMVDSVDRVKEVVQWCKYNKVEQCTVRPIRKPEQTADGECAAYVEEYGLEQHQIDAIHNWLSQKGRVLLRFTCGDHVAIVYDIDGQNIAEFDCLTVNGTNDDIRTLIYFPAEDCELAHVRYDWQYEGAVLM